MSQRHIYLLCSDHRHLSNSLDIYGSDLASAEKSVKKRTQFFSYCKTGMRSSKFVFYGRNPFLFFEQRCQRYSSTPCGVVVAQLAERLLPKEEVRSSNPVICKIL